MDQNGQSQTSTVSGLTEPSYFATDLIVGTEYAISVQATNVCGTSDRSPEIRLTAGTVPGSPCPVFTRAIADEKIQCTWGTS